MQKKQTAIEWLVEQYVSENYSNQVMEQAKQKEKEQRANLIYHCLGDFAAKHNIVIDGRDVSKWVEENIYNEK